MCSKNSHRYKHARTLPWSHFASIQGETWTRFLTVPSFSANESRNQDDFMYSYQKQISFQFEVIFLLQISLLIAWQKRRGFSIVDDVNSAGSTPRRRNLKTNTGHFRFVFRPFRKASRFLQCQAPFSWRISMDRRPDRINTAPFSNSSGVVWIQVLMGPKSIQVPLLNKVNVC